MNNELAALKPERLWYYFGEICRIPHPSKKEQRLREYIKHTAQKFGLEFKTDSVGNILVIKPASPGFEDRKTVILQSHIDMVCEKNNDTLHDFDIDPIQPWVDGEWVRARGTTLGADDGIGVAAQLAIMEDKDILHGPLELLFTVDEETGLSGAKGLKPGFMEGSILINLDSEDEGELFIGCAGGKNTNITLHYTKMPVSFDVTGFTLKVTGLKGGHSGDDINKGRGNAIKILNRLIWEANNKYELRISSFTGGNLLNAIAREAFATITVPKRLQKDFVDFMMVFTTSIKKEFRVTEPDLSVNFHIAELPSFVIDLTSQERLINSLYACPHGVISMSPDIPNFVETSTNLASLRINDKSVEIGTSQRSSHESGKEDIVNMVSSVFKLAGGKIAYSDGYPGWTPNPGSEIVNITKKAYQHLFNTEPKVLAIHAGLECGLIGENYPSMDMISYGPTVRGAHSPDESLLISTVPRFWELTLEVLRNIPKA